MSITLGTVPVDITVTLARGGNFLTTLVSETLWPAGLAVELHFLLSPAGDVLLTWPADISAYTVVWNMSALDVDQVIAANAKYVRLVCIDDATEDVLVWGRGEINVV